jgi:hypothetical protein
VAGKSGRCFKECPQPATRTVPVAVISNIQNGGMETEWLLV